MQFSADNCRVNRSAMSDLSATLSVRDRVARRTMTYTCETSPSFETVLQGAVKMTESDLASSYNERVLATSTVQQAQDGTAKSPERDCSGSRSTSPWSVLGTDPEGRNISPTRWRSPSSKR